jgi:hypothetical protein
MDIQVVVKPEEMYKIERMWEDRNWAKPVFAEFGQEHKTFTTNDAGVMALKMFNVPIEASIYGEWPKKKVQKEHKDQKPVKKTLTFL